MLNGEDVSGAIREPAVANAASRVAAVPGVRRALVVEQRRIAQGHTVVMEGRDIGSVVFPDSPFKFYIDASEEVRSARTQMRVPVGLKLPMILTALDARGRAALNRNRTIIDRLPMPLYLIPGNHDDAARLRATFATLDCCPVELPDPTGPFHYVGTDELTIGGERVAALHYRRERTNSGNQDGAEQGEVWFSAETGMPLRSRHEVEATTDTVIGEVHYTETGEWQLASLRPES